MDRSDAEMELAFIKNAIQESRRATYDYGMIMIVWGIITILGFCGNYVNIYHRHIIESLFWKDIKMFLWIWVTCTGIGTIYSVIHILRKRKTGYPRTFIGKIVISTWIGSLVAIILLTFIGTVTQGIRLWAISPVVSTILGVGFYISGMISSQRWCRNLAFCWWIGAFGMFLRGDDKDFWGLLIIPFMVFTFFIIPGIIIFYKERQRRVHE